MSTAVRIGNESPQNSSMDGHQADNAQNYITVIPVEYPRRIYPAAPDYVVDQYNEYRRERAREEYMRGDYNKNNEPQFEEVPSSYGPMVSRFERDHYDHDKHESFDVDRDRSLHSHLSSSTDASTKDDETTPSDTGPASRIPRAGPSITICVFLPNHTAVYLDLEDGSATTTQDVLQAVLHHDDISLPRSASSVFALWLVSPLLEIQLKPHHHVLQIRQKWQYFLKRFAMASEARQSKDEPILSLQRNVFYPKKEEEKIKDSKVLEFLFEEAKTNIHHGRYPCEVSHYIMLASIQARIELGPYNPTEHTIEFFRSKQNSFLPVQLRRTWWPWLRLSSSKTSTEVRIFEQFRHIPSNTPTRKLIRKYLEFCWSLPFYGGAFFQCQIEQPVRGITSLINHQDVPVLVAISSHGIYIIDDSRHTMLIGLKYEEVSWDFARPCEDDNPSCLPCLFLQFMVLENGVRVSKVLQVFSKQALMMDALVSVFVDELKQRMTAYSDEVDRPTYDNTGDSDDPVVPLTVVAKRENTETCLSNKLSKLTLATFDDDGRCIGYSGSWSFSH